MAEFDYIIAGGGTAGCVLAARLSEDPTASVLLLEAGTNDRSVMVRAPAAFSRLFKTRRDWDLATDPQERLDGRRIYWPGGRMLGGCSSINAMMVVRGHPKDYDRWARTGCDGWSFDDVLPYFRRSEDSARGPSEWRGSGGPLPVGELRDPTPATAAFLEAAARLGIPRCSDLNGPAPDGVEQTQVNQRNGSRVSVVDAYLRPAMHRPNLEVRRDTRVTRVILHQGRASGVEYRGKRGVGRVRARREVILAAGAVFSPQLLMLSGIGPGPALRNHGIPVAVDRPAVGGNLQDHLVCGVVMEAVGTPSLARAERLPALLRWFLSKRGPVTSNVAEACGFVRTRAELELPDLELIWAPVAFVDHGLTRVAGEYLSAGGILLQPRSRGRIRLGSSDPMVAPKIDPNYLSDGDGEDLRVLVESIKLVRRIFSTEPLASYVGRPFMPEEGVNSDEEIAAFVRERAETIYHPVGTCSMGDGPDDVLTPSLEVRGVDGLRVVDASVMPHTIRGHPHWPVIMIAEKAADLILMAR
jgi:choline dehydrogenase